uniref:Uncharacterized protein n=1 Tax=Staphylococcus phage 184DA TaxID=3110532 RepID=A0AAU6MX69_9CAUD
MNQILVISYYYIYHYNLHVLYFVFYYSLLHDILFRKIHIYLQIQFVYVY